jgi:hypothetical protein
MDDLDFMDGMAVVTVLSRAGLVGAQQAEESSGAWDGLSGDAREVAVQFVGVGATDGRLVFV